MNDDKAAAAYHPSPAPTPRPDLSEDIYWVEHALRSDARSLGVNFTERMWRILAAFEAEQARARSQAFTEAADLMTDEAKFEAHTGNNKKILQRLDYLERELRQKSSAATIPERGTA